MKQLNRLIKHDLVRGLKDVIFEKDKLCSSCQASKQVGSTHPKKSMMNTSKAFELLHMNLFGPIQYTSIGGNKYDFMIVDDYTKYIWVFFLVDKSDVFVVLSNHLSRAFTMNLKQPPRELKVTMVVSLRTQELMSCIMTLELDINSRPSTLHNQS
jgi:hypothetical protein